MLRERRFAEAFTEARSLQRAALLVYRREGMPAVIPCSADLDVVKAVGRLSEEDRLWRRISARSYGHDPRGPFRRDAFDKGRNAGTGKKEAAEITAACRVIAPGSARRTLWTRTTLADAVEKAYVHGGDNGELADGG